MNDKVIKNPNYKGIREFQSSLKARGKGAKDWPNAHTEIEYLGNGKFAASISGNYVFFDKTDGNKPKKHKLTNEQSSKGYILVQSAKCCVEVHPDYARFFDVQHEEVRCTERWFVRRKIGESWHDLVNYNPQVLVEEYSESTGDVVKVTVIYDTDYGILTVEYFQKDTKSLKHNVTFKNTSGEVGIFRVVQQWTEVSCDRVKIHGKQYSSYVRALRPSFVFGTESEPFKIREGLGDIYEQEKVLPCEINPQLRTADFVYGDWELTSNESLLIDPSITTLDNPTEDGYIHKSGTTYTRDKTGDYIRFHYDTKGDHDRLYVEWDISGIDNEATIDVVKFKYHGKAFGGWTDLKAMESQPSVQSDNDAGNQVIYDDVVDGTGYLISSDVFPEVGESKALGPDENETWDVDPKADVETALSNDWFAVGCFRSSVESFGEIYSEEYASVNPSPTLYVEYNTLPAVGIENKSANMAAKMVAAGVL